VHPPASTICIDINAEITDGRDRTVSCDRAIAVAMAVAVPE